MKSFDKKFERTSFHFLRGSMTIVIIGSPAAISSQSVILNASLHECIILTEIYLWSLFFLNVFLE